MFSPRIYLFQFFVCLDIITFFFKPSLPSNSFEFTVLFLKKWCRQILFFCLNYFILNITNTIASYLWIFIEYLLGRGHDLLKMGVILMFSLVLFLLELSTTPVTFPYMICYCICYLSWKVIFFHDLEWHTQISTFS